MGVFDWVPGRSPKVHAPEVTAEATRLANLAGMQASGQPWQADCAGGDTTALLETVHPDLADPTPIPEPDPEDVAKIAEDGGVYWAPHADSDGVCCVTGEDTCAQPDECPLTAPGDAVSEPVSDVEPVQAAQVPKTLPETVRELREALTARGITVPSKAVKADLEQLYADSTSE